MEYVILTLNFLGNTFDRVGLSPVLFVLFIISCWYFAWSVFNRFFR